MKDSNKISCKLKYSVVVLSLVFSSLCINAQNCRQFHKSRLCMEKNEPGFSLYGQSKSGFFEIDSVFSYEAILYGQKDYIVSVCTERGYEPIHYKIIDKETKDVFYDNIEDDYFESIGFTVDKPQKVIIEVAIKARGLKPDNFTENRACVGVLILWRKVSKLGF